MRIVIMRFKYLLKWLFILSSFCTFASDNLVESTQSKIDHLYERINEAIEIESDSINVLYISLGQTYASQNKYDSAYKYYDISLKIAHETNDTLQLALINKIIGSFYYDYENYAEAFNYYQESYNLYSELNNPIGISSLASNLGEINRLTGNYRKALKYYFSAIPVNEAYKNYSNLSINHNNVGLTYAHLQNYDSAFYHLKLGERIAVKHDITKSLNHVLNSLGTYYMLINKLDSSYYYFSLAMGQSKLHNMLFQIKENSKGLSQFFDKTGNTDSAYFYHKVFKKYNDSILNNTNLMRMGLLMVKSKLDNERRIERVEQSRKELFYFILVISVLSISVIILLLLLNQRNKTRHSLLKSEHLSLEKKYLNNELTNFALHISQNNHLLEEIKQSLKLIELSSDNKDQISELKLKLSTGLSNSQNKKMLEQQVDEQHREFIQYLQSKHQSLTKSELKLCSMLKLNLSTKDIAAINKVSPQAVKVARYRLRKKLQLQSDILIGDYLNTLHKD